jgi:hypothetical protein
LTADEKIERLPRPHAMRGKGAFGKRLRDQQPVEWVAVMSSAGFVSSPKQDVGIDKKPHGGPSNNPGELHNREREIGKIQTLPRSRPGARGSRLFSIGTSRPKGSPFRAITTSSPASARSPRHDSEDFA